MNKVYIVWKPILYPIKSWVAMLVLIFCIFGRGQNVVALIHGHPVLACPYIGHHIKHKVWRFWMTKLDAGLTTSLPAFDPSRTAFWDSKRINPWPPVLFVSDLEWILFQTMRMIRIQPTELHWLRVTQMQLRSRCPFVPAAGKLWNHLPS